MGSMVMNPSMGHYIVLKTMLVNYPDMVANLVI